MTHIDSRWKPQDMSHDETVCYWKRQFGTVRSRGSRLRNDCCNLNLKGNGNRLQTGIRFVSITTEQTNHGSNLNEITSH